MYIERHFARTTLRMFAGVIVWAVHFTAIYGFVALACARQFADVEWLGASVVVWAVSAATALATVVLLAVLVPAARAARGSFENWMSAGVAALALVAIVFETVPVVMVPTCA